MPISGATLTGGASARGNKRATPLIAAAALAVAMAALARGEVHPMAPALDSRPGAPYMLYLNFSGFNYNGSWGGGTPGNTPAYDIDGNADAFNSQELANIRNIWARVAEKFSAFNLSVTTIDPAVAAGQSGTDAQRQAYYDNRARFMHTVIGGNGAWSGGGGVSFLGVTQDPQPGTGFHTNWVFSAQAPANLQFVAEASAHENGHGLGLYHQSDYNSNTLVNEYSSNGGASGNGSYAPVMGDSYGSQRGTWRLGSAHVNSGGPSFQNDVSRILINS